MGYRLGVDLGTTYTAAAVYADGRAEVLGLGIRALQVPSVVHLGPGGEVLVGEAAEQRGATDPAHVVREFKRRIGDAVPVIVGGAPYSAQALTARLLAWVVGVATERRGEPPERICVTHPANWGPFKRDLLTQAVALAGLRAAEVETCPEPEAAALTYASRNRVAAGDRIAVYDLGGGTFDAAVLVRDGAGFRTAGPPEGLEHLGGIDFDEAVFRHVLGALGPAGEELDDTDEATAVALTRLRRDCVEAKEALSAAEDTDVAVLLPGIATSVRLTRAELEDMLRPAIAETVGAMRRVLESAHVSPDELAAIVLVGGSSRIPLVSEMLSAAFARPLAVDTHPKHDVALGAALRGTPAVLPAPPAVPAPGRDAAQGLPEQRTHPGLPRESPVSTGRVPRSAGVGTAADPAADPAERPLPHPAWPERDVPDGPTRVAAAAGPAPDWRPPVIVGPATAAAGAALSSQPAAARRRRGRILIGTAVAGVLLAGAGVVLALQYTSTPASASSQVTSTRPAPPTPVVVLPPVLPVPIPTESSPSPTPTSAAPTSRRPRPRPTTRRPPPSPRPRPTAVPSSRTQTSKPEPTATEEPTVVESSPVVVPPPGG